MGLRILRMWPCANAFRHSAHSCAATLEQTAWYICSSATAFRTHIKTKWTRLPCVALCVLLFAVCVQGDFADSGTSYKQIVLSSMCGIQRPWPVNRLLEVNMIRTQMVGRIGFNYAIGAHLRANGRMKTLFGQRSLQQHGMYSGLRRLSIDFNALRSTLVAASNVPLETSWIVCGPYWVCAYASDKRTEHVCPPISIDYEIGVIMKHDLYRKRPTTQTRLPYPEPVSQQRCKMKRRP